MRCVVDASVAVAWLLPSQWSQAAERFWRVAIDEAWDMLVPVSFHAEVASAVRLKVAVRQLEVYVADDIFQDLMALPVEHRWSRGLLARAWDLAKRYGHGRVYDAIYLALAETEHCELWTRDQRLVRSVQPRPAWLHLIGEEA